MATHPFAGGHPSPPSAAHRNRVGRAPRGPYTEIANAPDRRRVVVSGFAAPPCLADDGNSWNKIRYSGGTVEAKVNPFDWNTTLTVTGDAIDAADSAAPVAAPRSRPQVTALSYGQEAHRRVADMVALSLVATPLALFGILHKSKAHFVGIEYRGDDGKPGAVLLEADKNNYRAILQVLKPSRESRCRTRHDAARLQSRLRRRW